MESFNTANIAAAEKSVNTNGASEKSALVHDIPEESTTSDKSVHAVSDKSSTVSVEKDANDPDAVGNKDDGNDVEVNPGADNADSDKENEGQEKNLVNGEEGEEDDDDNESQAKDKEGPEENGEQCESNVNVEVQAANVGTDAEVPEQEEEKVGDDENGPQTDDDAAKDLVRGCPEDSVR